MLPLQRETPIKHAALWVMELMSCCTLHRCAGSRGNTIFTPPRRLKVTFGASHPLLIVNLWPSHLLFLQIQLNVEGWSLGWKTFWELTRQISSPAPPAHEGLLLSCDLSRLKVLQPQTGWLSPLIFEENFACLRWKQSKNKDELKKSGNHSNNDMLFNVRWFIPPENARVCKRMFWCAFSSN